MGLLDRGATALVGRMQVSAGRTVTYTRKSDAATVALTAWVGNTLYALEKSEPGATRVWGERDYFLAVADLVIASATFTPARGDRITETINGTATTFELSTPTGEPAWRYSDQTRQIYRLHCKRVA